MYSSRIGAFILKETPLLPIPIPVSLTLLLLLLLLLNWGADGSGCSNRRGAAGYESQLRKTNARYTSLGYDDCVQGPDQEEAEGGAAGRGTSACHPATHAGRTMWGKKKNRCFFLVFFFLTVVRASHAGARLEQLQDGDDETEIHI